LAIGIALTVVAALGLIPADLTVPANGRLLPAHRQHVFAEANGVVRALKTGHGSHVEKGDVLATLSSSELDFEITESLGALQTAAKRLSTIRSARLAMTPSDAAARREYNRLTAEEEATKAEIEGLKAQQSILTQRKSTLLVKSPLSGTVLTWDVARKLEARPVQRGEILMTVAQLNNDWIVELDVPDDRIGYVCQARDKTQADQPVELVLATDPTTKYSATIRSIALRSEPDQQGHPTVRVTAALDQRINTGLRPGAMVVARIHCGPRSLGFVWFHDLLEVIRTRVLF
jgi:multidrug efflux pump subunit AcrA (membrane-fusion protein)